ncbi:MAG: alpha/beta hydrolase [Candidatus Bathyarchaeota archaeon]|nr:alpha/beta hydrolase [Candidatus Bathyarchaeota archaeon]MDH5788089.1 alpha/beta hydrolase [Candidatus Bathyarchaeota archaeon]
MTAHNVHRLPGMVLIDHEFNVPLDYARPDEKTITVFAREAVAKDKENHDLPWLVFFQGGPGFGALRPEDKSGWLKRALKEYRVLLLDQRGTGRSTPINYQTLARFETLNEQADYLKNFRADSIVRDAELIRRKLIGEKNRWSVLGQSYGGFCVTHYLSAAPDGLKEAIITGGLPPLNRSPDDVYRATYRSVIHKNRLYYERYPDDVERVHGIVDYLASHEVDLPGGDRLSQRRFQQLGVAFGFSTGFEKVHYLLEDAFLGGSVDREISYSFLRGFENAFAFETNPIYAILHESIYCEGVASNWSAERVRSEFPEFQITPDKPVFLTGEMVYPWMFDEYKYLRPLKKAAEILATYGGWSHLYDKSVLQSNTVPCVAVIYYNDMYVERTLSEETARNIRGIKLWVTNEYEHDGLRSKGEKVLERLLSMLHGEI